MINIITLEKIHLGLQSLIENLVRNGFNFKQIYLLKISRQLLPALNSGQIYTCCEFRQINLLGIQSRNTCQKIKANMYYVNSRHINLMLIQASIRQIHGILVVNLGQIYLLILMNARFYLWH